PEHIRTGTAAFVYKDKRLPVMYRRAVMLESLESALFYQPPRSQLKLSLAQGKCNQFRKLTFESIVFGFIGFRILKETPCITDLSRVGQFAPPDSDHCF